MRRSILRDLLRNIVVASLASQAGCIFPGSGCPIRTSRTITVDGGLPDGSLSDGDCQRLCDPDGASGISTVNGCQPGTTDGGEPGLVCYVSTPCLGRRPGHLESEGSGRGSASTAEWLAEAAHLEAASIAAFRLLARELGEHDAPAHLCVAARRAALEEARHARAMTRLARRAGRAVRPVRLGAPPRRRSLEAIAIENAVEGCVGETWGALVAAAQAATSRDARLAAVLRDIAVDEAGHAALAWRIDAWARTRLSPAACRRLTVARQRAARRLARSCAADPLAKQLMTRLQPLLDAGLPA